MTSSSFNLTVNDLRGFYGVNNDNETTLTVNTSNASEMISLGKKIYTTQLKGNSQAVIDLILEEKKTFFYEEGRKSALRFYALYENKCTPIYDRALFIGFTFSSHAEVNSAARSSGSSPVTPTREIRNGSPIMNIPVDQNDSSEELSIFRRISTNIEKS